MASAAVGSTGPGALQLIGNLTGLRQQPVSVAGGVETTESAQNAMRFRASVFDARPTPEIPKPEKKKKVEAPEPEVEVEDSGTVVTASAPEPKVQAAPKEPKPEVKAPEDYTTAEIKDIIRAAAREFGLAEEYLLSVAECESSFNPRAVSSGGNYHGLFQFDYQTWNEYGYGNSIYNPHAQSRTAARLIAAGQEERWPNCA